MRNSRVLSCLSRWSARMPSFWVLGQTPKFDQCKWALPSPFTSRPESMWTVSAHKSTVMELAEHFFWDELSHMHRMIQNKDLKPDSALVALGARLSVFRFHTIVSTLLISSSANMRTINVIHLIVCWINAKLVQGPADSHLTHCLAHRKYASKSSLKMQICGW